MDDSKRVVSAVGGRRAVVGLGSLYVAIGIGWALELVRHGTPLASVVIVTLLIAGPGAVLVYGGYQLPRTDVRPEFYPTITSACLGGVGTMVALLTLYHVQPDDSLAGSFQTVLILTSLATVAGFGVGIHDVRAKTRERELEEQNRELRRVRAELEATVEKLQSSNERLEQFAYAASHDLQEPLRMVSSSLQLIDRRSEDDLSEESEEYLAFAVDGAERMREMIDGLLAYSRVETKGNAFEPVDLEDVIETAMTDLAVKIDDHDAEIAVDSLPRVEGDAGQLRQVFQNLLSNAIEYSGDGPPRVSVGAERDGPEWIVSVHDEGIGIDPDDQERIFEVFQ